MITVDPGAAARLRTALAEGPEPLMALLVELFTSLPGVRTMTVLATAPDRSMVHRIGTSDPANFPIGGFDPFDDSAWFRRIFGDRRSIVGNTPAEMAEFIPETAALEALGYGSTICVPIIVSGEVRGTVNLLGDANVFTPRILDDVDALMPLAALIFAFPGISDRRSPITKD
jgi:GAF domain-containing protein